MMIDQIEDVTFMEELETCSKITDLLYKEARMTLCYDHIYQEADNEKIDSFSKAFENAKGDKSQNIILRIIAFLPKLLINIAKLIGNSISKTTKNDEKVKKAADACKEFNPTEEDKAELNEAFSQKTGKQAGADPNSGGNFFERAKNTIVAWCTTDMNGNQIKADPLEFVNKVLVHKALPTISIAGKALLTAMKEVDNLLTQISNFIVRLIGGSPKEVRQDKKSINHVGAKEIVTSIVHVGASFQKAISDVKTILNIDNQQINKAAKKASPLTGTVSDSSDVSIANIFVGLENLENKLKKTGEEVKKAFDKIKNTVNTAKSNIETTKRQVDNLKRSRPAPAPTTEAYYITEANVSDEAASAEQIFHDVSEEDEKAVTESMSFIKKIQDLITGFFNRIHGNQSVIEAFGTIAEWFMKKSAQKKQKLIEKGYKQGYDQAVADGNPKKPGFFGNLKNMFNKSNDQPQEQENVNQPDIENPNPTPNPPSNNEENINSYLTGGNGNQLGVGSPQDPNHGVDIAQQMLSRYHQPQPPQQPPKPKSYVDNLKDEVFNNNPIQYNSTQPKDQKSTGLDDDMYNVFY